MSLPTAVKDLPNINAHKLLWELVYKNRGVNPEEETEKRSLEYLLSYKKLKGIDQAVEILAHAVVNNQSIVFAGDFDADGATGTALAIKAMRMMGAKKINFIVPNRFTYGYGLTEEIVNDLLKPEQTDVVVTIDNGISSIAGVASARAKGMKVIVTDHHIPGEILPNADVIVNPMLPDCTFESKNLAGVGVIFYVLMALNDHFDVSGFYTKQGMNKPDLFSLLDLVALGTIADLVKLDRNNRIMVYHGLKLIWEGKASASIMQLVATSKKKAENLSASDLGFSLGPRLNAAGRLEDMSTGIEYLIEDDPILCEEKAAKLDSLNSERKKIAFDIQEQAIHIIDNMTIDYDNLPKGLCLYDPSWHQGVIGIIASRIKDLVKRPVLIFTQVEDGLMKGSGRSTGGIHIRDIVANISISHEGLVKSFGGHSMALGLTIDAKRFSLFSQLFNEAVEATGITVGKDPNQIEIDCELGADLMTLETAEQILSHNPWGASFREPLFYGKFNIVSQKLVANNHLKLLLSVIDEPILLDGIHFFADLDKWPNYQAKQVEVIYRLVINEYRNTKKCQLLIERIEAMEPLAYQRQPSRQGSESEYFA